MTVKIKDLYLGDEIGSVLFVGCLALPGASESGGRQKPKGPAERNYCEVG